VLFRSGSGSTSDKIDGAPTNNDPDAQPVNASPVPTASVAKMVNPDNLPAYTGPTGSVEGTVTIKGLEAPKTPADFHRCPDAEKTWGTAFREGDGHALADVVVAVTGYEGFYVPEKQEAKQIVVRGCAFETRTLTMTFGQRIAVKNESKEFWTPILEPGANMVLRMATPGGDPVFVYPKNPGHYILRDRDRVRIGCASGRNTHVPAGLDDPVERAPVHHEVAQDWKARRAPRLDDERVPLLVLANVRLADRRHLERPLRQPVTPHRRTPPSGDGPR